MTKTKWFDNQNYIHMYVQYIIYNHIDMIIGLFLKLKSYRIIVIHTYKINIDFFLYKYLIFTKHLRCILLATDHFLPNSSNLFTIISNVHNTFYIVYYFELRAL